MSDRRECSDIWRGAGNVRPRTVRRRTLRPNGQSCHQAPSPPSPSALLSPWPCLRPPCIATCGGVGEAPVASNKCLSTPTSATVLAGCRSSFRTNDAARWSTLTRAKRATTDASRAGCSTSGARLRALRRSTRNRTTRKGRTPTSRGGSRRQRRASSVRCGTATRRRTRTGPTRSSCPTSRSPRCLVDTFLHPRSPPHRRHRDTR